MNYTITQIEDGILAMLRASAMKAYCHVFESWGGDVEELIASGKLVAPACYVGFGGATLAEGTGKTQEAAGLFSIMLFARNLRSEAAARRGGPKPNEIGAYQMIEEARAALHLSNLGLQIDGGSAVNIRRLDVGTQFAAYALDIAVEWMMESQEEG
jgi:phage gp37-like protein